MTEMVSLGGLWKQKDKNGNPFLSGSFGFARLFVFPNANKRGDKDPDYYVKLANSEKREGGGRQQEQEEEAPF